MNDSLLMAIIDALNELVKYFKSFFFIQSPSFLEISFQFPATCIFHYDRYSLEILDWKCHFELYDVLMIKLSKRISLLIYFIDHVSFPSCHLDKLDSDLFLCHFIESQIDFSKSTLHLLKLKTNLPHQVSLSYERHQDRLFHRMARLNG